MAGRTEHQLREFGRNERCLVESSVKVVNWAKMKRCLAESSAKFANCA